MRRVKRAAVAALAAFVVPAGCGGGNDPPHQPPTPVTYDSLASQVHRLADELRWGCTNAAKVRAQANRVTGDADRLGDPDASRIAAKAVSQARDEMANCP